MACLDSFREKPECLADKIHFISCILLNFKENLDDANPIIYSYRILITCAYAKKKKRKTDR